MPAKSEKQRKFMGAELGRKRAGKKTETGMSEGQLEDFASKSLTKSIDNFISDRRITKTMAKNDISKSTGAKTRTTLKTSTKLPKPKKMTMQNPGTAKNKKPPVKRMNVKKSIELQKGAGELLANVKPGGIMKPAGKNQMFAVNTKLPNPKPYAKKGVGPMMGQKPTRKAIGIPGGVPSMQPVAPMKTVPSMDKGLGSDYVKMPEPLNVMIRKAFTVLVPAIQKEMEKDLKKGTGDMIGGGLIGTGIGALTGGLPGALAGGAIGSGAGHFGGRAMDRGALTPNLSESKNKVKSLKKVDIKKNPLAAAAAADPKGFGEGVKGVGEGISAATGGKGIQALTPMGQMNAALEKSPKCGKNVEKGWKQTAGMLGGAALGTALGPAGAALGALGGKKLGEHFEKPKVATKTRTPRAKTVSATRMMTAKNPRTRVTKAFPPAGSNLTSKDVKINKVSYKKGKDSPVKKSFLTEDNSVLTSTTKKIVRDSKDYHEEINDVLTKKQPDMERSELDMAKSQASLRVEKAIFYLKGYEPMDDNSVKKMFHGQIPELMKSAETRPPQSWMEKSVSKSAAFVEDPIKYSMELWYDINKAVAEPIDSKLSPKKKGEDEQISDGTRCDVSDLAGKDKSETTETL